MTEATTESPDQNSIPPKRKEQPILVNAGFTDEPVTTAVLTPKTKFFRGVWANKTNENDQESVRIGVNGEILTFQRGVECIVPEPYLPKEIHARYPKFKQEPGKGRKTIGYVDRYSFEIRGPATFAEFKKMFTEGNKKTREAVQQHGLQIPVEQAVPQLE